jgi:hypothetical protein
VACARQEEGEQRSLSRITCRARGPGLAHEVCKGCLTYRAGVLRERVVCPAAGAGPHDTLSRGPDAGLSSRRERGDYRRGRRCRPDWLRRSAGHRRCGPLRGRLSCRLQRRCLEASEALTAPRGGGDVAALTMRADDDRRLQLLLRVVFFSHLALHAQASLVGDGLRGLTRPIITSSPSGRALSPQP